MVARGCATGGKWNDGNEGAEGMLLLLLLVAEVSMFVGLAPSVLMGLARVNGKPALVGLLAWLLVMLMVMLRE